MKNFLFIIASISLLGCNQAADRLIAVQESGTLNYKVANAKSSLPIYHAEAGITDEAIEDLKSKFGVYGPKTGELDTWVVRNGNKELHVDKKTGQAFYKDISRLWTGKASTSLELDESRDIAIAEAEIKTRNLAQRQELQVFQVNKLTSSNNIDKKVHLDQTEVVFKRKLNEHLVVGTGSQISVFLANDVMVNGIIYDWPTLRKGKPVQISEPNDLNGLLEREIGKRNEKVAESGKIRNFRPMATFLDYSAIYHPDGSRDIIPVYAVKGQKQDDTSSTVEIFITPASADVAVPEYSPMDNESASIGLPPNTPISKE